jgi:pyridoxamine 5'-phosphate oxidase
MSDTGPDTLEGILAQITALWQDAVRNRHSALHTPVVCTIADATPAPRIMVLRAVSPDVSGFRFHTDARSPKATQIADNAPVSLLGYDPASRIQLTVQGHGQIEQRSALAEQAWAASALSSRRCYLAAHAPGTPVDRALSGIPDELIHRAPTAEESMAGRANFAILRVEATQLDWLKLTSCGNRRARFTRVDGVWRGTWITP